MDTVLRDIKKRLRLRMNGVASTAMRNSGMNYKVNFGLDAFNIKEIAALYKPDAYLADLLWQENIRECKILATLIHPKTSFTSEKADAWLSNCFLPELTEQLVFNLLQYVDFAPAKAAEWISAEAETFRVGGYTLALRLLLRKLNTQGSEPRVTLDSGKEKDHALALKQATMATRQDVVLPNLKILLEKAKADSHSENYQLSQTATRFLERSAYLD